MQQKFLKAEFTLDDFLNQMQQMKNMGPLDQVLDMIPGMNKAKLKGMEFDEKSLLNFKLLFSQ